MRNVRRGALPEIVVILKPSGTEEVIPPALGNPGAGLGLYIAR